MTQSYARHVASDKLFDQLNSQIDQFVEVYIGKYGRPKLAPADLKLGLVVYNDKSMVEFVDKCIGYLTKDVITIRDDMLASLNQTKYLFTLQ